MDSIVRYLQTCYSVIATQLPCSIASSFVTASQKNSDNSLQNIFERFLNTDCGFCEVHIGIAHFMIINISFTIAFTLHIFLPLSHSLALQ